MKNKLSKPIDRHIQLWRSEAEAYGHRQLPVDQLLFACFIKEPVNGLRQRWQLNLAVTASATQRWGVNCHCKIEPFLCCDDSYLAASVTDPLTANKFEIVFWHAYLTMCCSFWSPCTNKIVYQTNLIWLREHSFKSIADRSALKMYAYFINCK